MMYQLSIDSTVILMIELDGTIRSVPKNEMNRDYAKYLEWLAEGNEPLSVEGE